jgi:curved DNA-binding protein CbpA
MIDCDNYSRIMAIEYDPTADYYVTLGVDDSATQDDIKKAHRERIRDLHPDHGGDSAHAVAVNLARDVLGEPSTRRTYDRARRAWFMERLKDPTISTIFDRDGRHAARFAAQQRTDESENASDADAKQRATPGYGPLSGSEQAARHARPWQWGVIADFAWPDVRKALRAGDWLPAIAWLGTALLADRAIELHCPTGQLAALDALIGPRQRERKAKLMETIAQALGRQLSRDVEELATQLGGVGRHAASPNARASRQPVTRRHSPAARNGVSRPGSR